MSDTASEKELDSELKDLVKVAVINLQKILPAAPGGKSWEDIEEGLKKGQTIKDICGVSDEKMEKLFGEGQEKFEQNDFEDARNIFASLCLYDQLNSQYWCYLARTCENLDRYKDALTAYQLMTVATRGIEPLPYLGMGYCNLCLGDIEAAREALDIGKDLCMPDSDDDRLILDAIEDLLSNCNQ